MEPEPSKDVVRNDVNGEVSLSVQDLLADPKIQNRCLKYAKKLYGRGYLGLIPKQSWHSPEDLVQDTMQRAIAACEQVQNRTSRGVEAWLQKIQLNRYLEVLREERHVKDFVIVDEGTGGTVESHEDEFIRTEYRDRVKAEWERMPERQKIVLQMRLLEKKQVSEICEAVGLEKTRVYDLIKAGTGRLLKLLERVSRTGS